jgi:actin-related protein
MNDLKDVEIYLTKNDQVLNWEKTETFVKRIFPNAKTIVLEGKNYPHHLMAPLVSKYADTIKNNL